MTFIPAPIDILMVTYNRRDFTEKAINHIIERTSRPFRLVVVDNASKDGTRGYLQALRKMGIIDKLLLNNENVGLQKAKNIGLEHIKSELYVDTDNDCLVPAPNSFGQDWLSLLEGLMEKYSDFAAISLRPQVLVGVGPIFKDAPEVVENNLAGGSFRIMRKKAVDEVGGWADYFENRAEEWNICTKLRKAGWKVGYCRDIFTYHMFGENWGYPTDVNHYHRAGSEIYAKDQDYDPITMVPKIKGNE